MRYVLEGSVRRSRDNVRVNAQLIDAETAAHIWAERFDQPAGDLFALQDEITSRIAVALDLELLAVEASQMTERPDAMEYILADNLGADLDQFFPEAGQRPQLGRLRHRQRPHEVAEVVRQGMKLKANCVGGEGSARQAIPWLEKGRSAIPTFPLAYSFLGAAYALNGELERGAKELAGNLSAER